MPGRSIQHATLDLLGLVLDRRIVEVTVIEGLDGQTLLVIEDGRSETSLVNGPRLVGPHTWRLRLPFDRPHQLGVPLRIYLLTNLPHLLSLHLAVITNLAHSLATAQQRTFLRRVAALIINLLPIHPAHQIALLLSILLVDGCRQASRLGPTAQPCLRHVALINTLG